jgi:hypothetical protein
MNPALAHHQSRPATADQPTSFAAHPGSDLPGGELRKGFHHPLQRVLAIAAATLTILAAATWNRLCQRRATQHCRLYAMAEGPVPKRLASRVLAYLVAATAVAVLIGVTLAPAARPATAAAQTERATSVVRLVAEPQAVRRVVLYGDSLAAQSQEFFAAKLASAGITQVTTRTFGGTAICDWLGKMRVDAMAIHPDAVVVEFSGNALTPCMEALDDRPLSGAAYFAKYAADAAAVLRIFTPRHAIVLFAGAPISRSAERSGDPTTAILHALYAALARTSPYGRYTDAGASVLSGGRWTETLPCLPAEPCTGGRDANGTLVNVVRAPDGGHFCPGAPAAVRGVTAACPVWASGAWRFGIAMAAPVIAELAALQ